MGRPLGAAAKVAVVLDGGGKPPPYQKYKCKPSWFTAKFQFIDGRIVMRSYKIRIPLRGVHRPPPTQIIDGNGAFRSTQNSGAPSAPLFLIH